MSAHEVILEGLRFWANHLLRAYDAAPSQELWDAFEKAAQACECLMPLITEDLNKVTYH